MKLTITILFLFLSIPALSQDSTLPDQYVKIKEVFGDLDKDAVEEKVVVYNVSAQEIEDNGIDREVVIFKKAMNGWKIWHRSLLAVGNSRDGGMMGDPFEDIEIVSGILIISHSGGSSWKWGHTDKYRYQNKSFELIGYSAHYGKLCEYWGNFDYNLSTGKIEYLKKFEKCDDEESQEVYKTEKENFIFKSPKKITLNNRRKIELKIVTPKYKEELYL